MCKIIGYDSELSQTMTIISCFLIGTNLKVMKKNSVEYNGLVGGIIILIGLILYFFLMKSLGLEHNLNLRAFNLLIMASGVWYAIKKMKQKNKDFDYLKGIGTGLLAAASSSLLFAIFIFIDLQFIEPNFLQEIIDKEPFGFYLNAFKISFIIIIEGFGSGFLLTFGMMQWFKKRVPQNLVDEDLHQNKTK